MVPVLTEVASGSPELLFFPIFQPEGDFIVQQVHEVSGMDGVTLMAADGLMVSNFMELPESEGLYFSGPDLRYGFNKNQRVIGSSPNSFLTGYVGQYGEKPSAAFWAHSFDATTLLLDAIEAASYVDDDDTLVIDRAGVREFLSGVRDYQGFTGLLSCDEFGDCGSQKITVIGHTNSSDVDGSLANVIYEYSPAGGSQVGLLYDFSATSEFMQGFVDEKGLNGATVIVVDRDEGVIYRDDFGEFGPGRISLLGNISETFSVGILMGLHDDGLLDIDAPISDAVSWGTGMPDVTVAQLLSHSSGMLGGPASSWYAPYLCANSYTDSLQECGEEIATTPDDDADLVPPDTEFRWPATGADLQVAGAIAEAVSGKSWAELVDETWVRPCGMDTLAYKNPWNEFTLNPITWGYLSEFAGDPSTLTDTDNPSIHGWRLRHRRRPGRPGVDAPPRRDVRRPAGALRRGDRPHDRRPDRPGLRRHQRRLLRQCLGLRHGMDDQPGDRLDGQRWHLGQRDYHRPRRRVRRRGAPRGHVPGVPGPGKQRGLL